MKAPHRVLRYAMACTLGWQLTAVLPPASAADVQSSATFTPEGHATRDGKPIFPLGIYVALTPGQTDKNNAALQDISAAQFDFTINYAGNQGDDKQIADYYSAVASHGLTEFYPVEKFYKDIGNDEWQLDFKESEQEIIQSHINKAKGYPGVAGWYILDEEPFKLDVVQQHHAWAKEADPTRPTLIVAYKKNKEDIALATQMGDIVSIDHYPIPTGQIETVSDIVNRMIESAKPDQPAWFVAQAFGNYQYIDHVRNGTGPALRPDDAGLRNASRAPTPAEMRNMCYQALARGARGLVIYYYTDIQSAFDSATRWQAVKKIAADIKQIEPILLSETVEEPKFSNDNFSIIFRAFKHDGKLYVLAVNTSRDYQGGVFDNVPIKIIKSVKVIQGDGFAGASSTWGPSELMIGLDGLESIVVEIGQ